jgi:hypothetical protein
MSVCDTMGVAFKTLRVRQPPILIMTLYKIRHNADRGQPYRSWKKKASVSYGTRNMDLKRSEKLERLTYARVGDGDYRLCQEGGSRISSFGSQDRGEIPSDPASVKALRPLRGAQSRAALTDASTPGEALT